MTARPASARSRDAWLEIDLGAIRRNVEVIRSLVGAAAVAPVVKADAYGHGLEVVGPALAPHVEALCVAGLDEALALRRLVAGRIIQLYPVPADGAADAVAAGIELTVMASRDLAAARAAARSVGAAARIHLGLDTGMGRGGVAPEAIDQLMRDAVAEPGLEPAGLWTHLHSPEEPLSAASQVRRFESAVERLRQAGLPVPPRHVAASGGIFAADAPPYELVRPGLAIYGVLDHELPVAPGATEAMARLRPAMALKARAVAFSLVPAGGTVGYGATWRAERPSRVAVLPVGYGDGYLRASQPGAVVLARGRRLPVVGRVSMDALCVDVTDVPDLGHEDEVVLLGPQGREEITAAELARRRNTIAWEVLTGMARRLARVYYPQAGTTRDD